MKIAVIGHTTHLNRIDDLSPRGQLALAESDLILHVGGIGSLALLKSIQDRFGLLFAVYSQQDPDEIKRYLDADKVIEFANCRIGMIFEADSSTQGFSLRSLKRQLTPETLSEQLLTIFTDVDCVVFGSPTGTMNHLHHGKLIFNPGKATNNDGSIGTIGILDMTDRSITGRIIPL